MKKAIILNLFIITTVLASFDLLDHFRTVRQNSIKTSITTSNFKGLGSACGTDNSCSLTNPCIYGSCINSVCVSPQAKNIGASCTSQDICNLGTCIAGTCQAQISYACPCTFNSTLGGLYQLFAACDTGLCLQNGRCGYPRSAGAVCSQSFECLSNSCILAVCASNKNIGDSCITSATDSCPSNAYCDNNSQTSSFKCIKFATTGQNCNGTQCSPFLVCDTTSMTCRLSSTRTTGQSCINGADCVASNYCNSGSTCTAISTVVGNTCSNTAPCLSGSTDCICDSSSGTGKCQTGIGLNCDAQNSAFISCMVNNCPNQGIDPASKSCMSKKCGNQIGALYCCFGNNLSSDPLAQAGSAQTLNYINCNNKSFKGSSCDPNSASSIALSAVTIVIAILSFLL